MSDTPEKPPKDSPQRKQNPNQDPQMNWRGLVLFAVAFFLIGGAFLFRGGAMGEIDELTYNQFLKILEEGRIVATADQPLRIVVEEGRKTETIAGYYKKTGTSADADTVAQFRTPVLLSFQGRELERLLEEKNVVYSIRPESNLLGSTLIGLLPILLFLVILYFFFRSQIKMAGKGAMNFGKSKARMLNQEKNRVTFKNVAGVEEAKDEVQELVEFLKDPKKFQKLGGRIPKGVLMVGPPGTGKTLLAKAIAGEADVPFFSMSGSDFVEMFVGVGAARVRDTFEQAKKHSPCIIFIDEIDAVGRQRGAGVGGGNDEREQTLNSLLVEMDGMEGHEGVIVIAATNRADVLDAALKRPGRFDRNVFIDLPDVVGREQILRVHARKVNLAESVDLTIVARATPGLAGADLANLLNESALIAARHRKEEITMAEIEEARDKVTFGRERRKVMDDKDKRVVAWHEAGHALVQCLLDDGTLPVHKVTIIPRGASLGSTMFLPSKDTYNYSKSMMERQIASLMGGRIAEDITFSEITSGASGDIKQATKIARSMVCEWGMSDLGPVALGENQDTVFLGREITRSEAHSEQTSQKIDEAVRKIIDSQYDRAYSLITSHRTALDAIAEALMEFETIDGVHVKEIIEHGEVRSPVIPSPSAVAYHEKIRQEQEEKEKAAAAEKPEGGQGPKKGEGEEPGSGSPASAPV